MPPFDGAATAPVMQNQHGPTSTMLVATTICLIWYLIVVTVCTIGYVQIFRHYSRPPVNWFSPNDAAAGPTVTIIRPVKGIEPYLYECLASTFHQEYFPHKLLIRFCVSSRDDPAFPILEQLVKDYGNKYNVQILVEEEDEYLQSPEGRQQVGPNPKIRNMSRAYREADRDHGGVVWIIDCNVWVESYTLYKMLGSVGRYKFVHQLPMTVDPGDMSQDKGVWSSLGTRMDEMFMSTAHPKFYLAINTVAVAPCTLGKSTMFLTHHFDALTDGKGLDYFSHNICEDQLIGDLLWKNKVPEEKEGVKLGKHALCHGVIAIQPLPNMTVGEYWNRRIRWLRVRKFTVTLATFVEPGTESFFCSVYGAFASTTLPWFNKYLGIPQTWTAFGLIWMLSVSIWCAMDWTLFRKLQSGASIPTEEADNTQAWAKSTDGMKNRPLGQWLLAWLGREALALPIWTWAIYGGTQVEWRGKKFRVGMDMKVHEIVDEEISKGKEGIMNGNGHAGLMNGKARRD